jgi:integrase/recombinase XerD
MKFLKATATVMKPLTDEQIQLLMNYKPKKWTDKRLKALVLTLLGTGCRIDELLTLKRTHVDFDNLLIRVTGKGDKERVIPFSIELRKILYKFYHSHEFDLVFCTVDGHKITYCNALRDFTKLTVSLGFRIENSAFHALRRTFATNFIRGGGNPFVLQRILGHTSISQTQTYVKLVTEDLSEAHARTSVLNRLR